MMRLPSIAVLLSSLFVAACSSTSPSRHEAPSAGGQAEPAAKTARAESSGNRVTIRDAAGSVTLQKVAFRPGVSTTTVERLARSFSCTGGAGAGLITEKGPVEVYRMACDNGTVFLAQCELRQCRPMR